MADFQPGRAAGGESGGAADGKDGGRRRPCACGDQAFLAASRYTSSGGLLSSIVDSSTTTLSTFDVLGSSNIVSISDCSRIERRPRAPVLRASALRAMARS